MHPILPEDFDAKLRGFLQRRLSVNSPSHLSEAIVYGTLGPGKRIRPLLSYATAHLFDLHSDATFAAAAAIELIHAFTLIHDDLPCMDNDDFRRGRPTVHKKFDQATALLAGDALIPLAFDCLLELPAEAAGSPQIQHALRVLSQSSGARGVIAGQAREIRTDSIHDLYLTFELKTGALFQAAVLMPLALSGSSSATDHDLLSRFASELGIAFQVADDLEDQGQDFPTHHLLHWMSPEQARSQWTTRLQSTSEQIQKRWAARALPLQEILQRVQTKLTSSGDPV